jgi:hypothetical protein
MARVIRTGAHGYILYGWETSNFGTVAASINRAFGLKTSIGTLSLTNNRIDLGKLGQVETAAYAYGQQSGSISVNYVLADSVTSGSETSGDIFRAIFGAPTGTVYGGLTQGSTPKVSESMTIDVGFETGEDSYVSGHTDYKVRTLQGCVLNSLSISTAVNDVVNVSTDFAFGIENAPSKSFSAPTITCGNPYTFAHAKLKLATGTETSVSEITLIQDTDLTFTVNNELLYGLASNQATSSFRRMLDITGRFKVAWSDWKLYERMLAQIGKGSSGNRESNISTQSEGTVELELKFTNGSKSITIELAGISFTDFAVSGIEPVEPVYQEVNYKAKTAQVTVDTT